MTDMPFWRRLFGKGKKPIGPPPHWPPPPRPARPPRRDTHVVVEVRTITPPPTDPADPTHNLTDEECRNALRSLFRILWWEVDEERYDTDSPMVNPEKEWGSDIQRDIQEWAEDFGLAPVREGGGR